MAEIGVHGFPARDDQHHRAHDQQGVVESDALQELQAVKRVERRQDLRVGGDLPAAEGADHGEPERQNRAEKNA